MSTLHTLAEDRQTLLTVDGAGKSAKAAALARIESAATAPAPSPACVIPTLADVENWGRDGRQEGFFIFFEGKHCGWTCRLLSRGAPDAITSWRPGCVAIRADGEPGAWRAVGGSYHSGADRWEAIA